MIKLIINILYITFCGIVTLVLLPFLFLTLAGNIVSFKLILYVLFLSICIIGLWSLIFLKIKQVVKLLILFVLLPFTIYLFLFQNQFGFVNMNTCIDVGICKEGFKTKDNNGNTIVINKNNCTKNGFKWYEEDKSCNLRLNN